LPWLPNPRVAEPGDYQSPDLDANQALALRSAFAYLASLRGPEPAKELATLSASAFQASSRAQDWVTVMLLAFACPASLRAPDSVTAMLSAFACPVSLRGGSATAKVSV